MDSLYLVTGNIHMVCFGELHSVLNAPYLGHGGMDMWTMSLV